MAPVVLPPGAPGPPERPGGAPRAAAARTEGTPRADAARTEGTTPERPADETGRAEGLRTYSAASLAVMYGLLLICRLA